MRQTRALLLLIFCLLTLVLYLSVPQRPSVIQDRSNSHVYQRKTGIRALFSFDSPLFPSSAIISLTDDNSTFFLSRPAAFGPLLPHKGFSGQLWVGSGFGEDPRGWVGAARLPEGELGCSDAPQWEEILKELGKPPGAKLIDPNLSTIEKKISVKKLSSGSRISPLEEGIEEKEAFEEAAGDDGLDGKTREPASGNTDADIRFLQQSAEISGKIVLLSRGGCGFLDKTKWAQRRGGVALIVGDNIPGGPLVTMYAKGDADNITIPAIFTSHTTAHLLSSLLPSGGRIAGTAKPKSTKDEKNGALGAKIAGSGHVDESHPQGDINGPGRGVAEDSNNSEEDSESRGLFGTLLSYIFGRRADSNVNTNVDWAEASGAKQSLSRLGTFQGVSHKSEKKFIIGIDDWRDPDFTKDPSTSSPIIKTKKTSLIKRGRRFAGGSVIPGSGEYKRATVADRSLEANSMKQSIYRSEKKLGESENVSMPPMPKTLKLLSTNKDIHIGKSSTSKLPETIVTPDLPPIHHDGLWVTLTPATSSSSPFFDTILVLVISPLVTLTVVYAMLLVRSRIRRRRWRAPKSVVERLPVRTYHTIESSGASSSAIATPIAQSPTTPLLQRSSEEQRSSLQIQHNTIRLHPPPHRIRTRGTHRSRTASEASGISAPASGAEDDAVSLTESEQREKGLEAWRRKYGGRQRECVVCLEEYVDGISKVMSLPCGHEFHVDCITPWLTTRRRTCPICKGDVVHSMARHRTPSSPQTTQPQALQRQSSFMANHSLPDEEDVENDTFQSHVSLMRTDEQRAHETITQDDEVDREREHEGIGDWIASFWRALWIGRPEQRDSRRRGSRDENDVDRDR